MRQTELKLNQTALIVTLESLSGLSYALTLLSELVLAAAGAAGATGLVMEIDKVRTRNQISILS
ncbi:hypothetical protein GQ44DRAFT_780162 [Phaeosphaeriaceae sp. PMI808]|nr:hypothetical protein GQ44DRAFT_780162 [Phaeosphaeriaceae sp. PMI808]